MKQNNVFQASVKIWINQFIYTLIGIVIAMILLVICINMLNIDTMEYYEKYVQMCIVALGFAGLIFGTNKVFRDIRDNKMYLSRKTKYLVLLYQLIAFAGFAAICLANKLGVVCFIGGYLTIFLQFLFNYYYTKYNNYKFPKNLRRKKKVTTNYHVENQNEGMIDIDKLR